VNFIYGFDALAHIPPAVTTISAQHAMHADDPVYASSQKPRILAKAASASLLGGGPGHGGRK